MIFDQNTICAPVFCTEFSGETDTVLPDAELILVLVSSGLATVSADSGSVLLSAGELYLVPRCRVQIKIISECHVLSAGMTGLAVRTAADGLQQPLISDCSACPMAAQLLSELCGAMRIGGSAGLSALCYHLLCEISAADSAVPHLSPLVSEAVLAIRRNYAGLYGVEELSDQLGVSKSHLVRAFSAEMGIGPGQYLTNVRVDAVKTLLTRRDYSLEVIATLSGFSGANYLCKVFKKHTGMTPAAYRAQNAVKARGSALNELEDALYI